MMVNDPYSDWLAESAGDVPVSKAGVTIFGISADVFDRQLPYFPGGIIACSDFCRCMSLFSIADYSVSLKCSIMLKCVCAR